MEEEEEEEKTAHAGAATGMRMRTTMTAGTEQRTSGRFPAGEGIPRMLLPQRPVWLTPTVTVTCTRWRGRVFCGGRTSAARATMQVLSGPMSLTCWIMIHTTVKPPGPIASTGTPIQEVMRGGLGRRAWVKFAGIS